ncbi:MAG: DUF5009 domain-containing protein [Ignavibacteria bacterium]|nr:DUF5009 domain-containing protein [Ignavibacteria bacterium]
MNTNRIKSIDIFRGITIFTMIFVNDVAGVSDTPWWMKHFPAEGSGMTFVDVVFPAFLFIVGTSIPFAIVSRVAKGESSRKIWMHIVIRSIGLMILGLYFVNLETFNLQATGMSSRVWLFLFMIAILLVWNTYKSTRARLRNVIVILRILGIALLGYLAYIYRSNYNGEIAWMHTSYWGILGLIGWAYLGSSLVYMLFGKKPVLIGLCIALFILLYPLDKLGLFNHLSTRNFLWIGGHFGAHAAITTTGMLVGILISNKTLLKTLKTRLYTLLSLGMILAVLGLLTIPPYGINKNLATPAWVLLSSSICVLIFTFLYWLIDVHNNEGWFLFLRPAATNPLLAYLLPVYVSLFFYFSGITFYRQLGYGITGIIRSLIFSFVLLGITHAAGKIKLRLHL